MARKKQPKAKESVSLDSQSGEAFGPVVVGLRNDPGEVVPVLPALQVTNGRRIETRSHVKLKDRRGTDNGRTGPARFRHAIELMPAMLRDLKGAQEYDQTMRLDIPLRPGVYLFTEDDVPMYVGQTRKLRNRYDYHTHPRGGHNQASFAFLLAKETASKAGLDIKRKRDDLQADPKFAQHFTAAKARVARMTFQYLLCDDPINRTLFEIYAALSLGTEKYNSFQTH